MRSIVTCSVVFLFSLCFAGCSITQVAFPAGSDRGSFVPYDVKGKNDLSQYAGKLSIGDYSVKVSDGWSSANRTSGSSLFANDTATDACQKYSVSISGPDGFSWSGDCKAYAKVEQESVKLSASHTTTSTKVLENSLLGVFTSADKQQYEMKLREVSDKVGADKKGYIKGKDVSLDLESTSRIADSDVRSWRVTGYYIYEKGTLVAVMDYMKLGRVYISRTARKEAVSAILNAAAALFAYQDPARNQ